MATFREYAKYYDLLYREKDYAAESAFVTALLGAHLPGPERWRILELGCGTGRHGRALAANGHQVLGVDLSADMLELAAAELAAAAPDVRGRVTFSQGDLRRFRVGQTFDAVVSLFHVMSYQTSDEAIREGLATARAHLEPGGLFVFDAWYGPGVLTDPPAVRVKRAQGADCSLLRVTEPTLRARENRVDVSFTLFVRDACGRVVDTVEEVHHLRYLFAPEIAQAAQAAGFAVVEHGEWLTRRPPDDRSWYAYWVLRAVAG
jgi:SAM-dependent methyltransferase